MRKISVVSSSRSDYGILKTLIYKIQKDKFFQTSVYVTGSHLSKEFGKTFKEIREDKIKIKKKIYINFSNDKSDNLRKAISEGINKFSKEFKINKPDILIVLGDRYEIFSVVIAAMINQIPIAHIHGGESTEGVIDEAIRHSITKMSHIHFASTKKYSNRIQQMGENKKYIFNVGSLGVENIKKYNFISRDGLQKKFKFRFKERNLVITLHPETLGDRDSEKNIRILLNSFQSVRKNTCFIFTMPGAELGYKVINEKVKTFCKRNKNAHYFKSLGQRAYLSICKYSDCVIGNSSSGIIEAPSLKMPTINIGDRQSGRVRAKSVIDTKFNSSLIKKALKIVYDKKFKKKIKSIKNPYYKKNTSREIIEVLKKIKLEKIIFKKFIDKNIYGN